MTKKEDKENRASDERRSTGATLSGESYEYVKPKVFRNRSKKRRLTKDELEDKHVHPKTAKPYERDRLNHLLEDDWDDDGI